MDTTKKISVEVRRDLPLFELIALAGLVLEGMLTQTPAFMHMFGGHMYDYDGELYPAEGRRQIQPHLLQHAKPVCMDYTVDPGTSGVPFGNNERHEPLVSTTEVTLVYPGDGWERLGMMARLANMGLRPASFYEHISLVASRPDLAIDHTLVPFGAWTNPLTHSCVGLTLVKGNRLLYSEGGAGYTRNTDPSGVAFTAVALTK